LILPTPKGGGFTPFLGKLLKTKVIHVEALG